MGFKLFCVWYFGDWSDLLLTGCPDMHYGIIYGDELGAIS
jgi:hypothetical protein